MSLPLFLDYFICIIYYVVMGFCLLFFFLCVCSGYLTKDLMIFFFLYSKSLHQLSTRPKTVNWKSVFHYSQCLNIRHQFANRKNPCGNSHILKYMHNTKPITKKNRIHSTSAFWFDFDCLGIFFYSKIEWIAFQHFLCSISLIGLFSKIRNFLLQWFIQLKWDFTCRCHINVTLRMCERFLFFACQVNVGWRCLNKREKCEWLKHFMSIDEMLNVQFRFFFIINKIHDWIDLPLTCNIIAVLYIQIHSFVHSFIHSFLFFIYFYFFFFSTAIIRDRYTFSVLYW